MRFLCSLVPPCCVLHSCCLSTPPSYVLLVFTFIFSLCAIVVHWHFIVSTLATCWHLIAMCCCCPLAFPCCVLLVLEGASLLHTFLLINTSNPSTFLTASVFYRLLVVCYCCSLTLSCCAFSKFINASLLFFVLLLFVNTSLLSSVGVHWHLLVMRCCCSLARCCYVLLLFVNASLLCVFVVN